LVFLPPYSLDFNPIEQAFAAIKAFLWHHWTDKGLTIIEVVIRNITPEKAWGYFYSSGYIQ
ncbi:hypothetical protein F5146DRAFT_931952, partial [Armillaria mellea]